MQSAGDRRRWRFVAPAALAACGLLLVLSARSSDGTDLRDDGVTSLSDLIRVEEQKTQELESQVEELNEEIDSLTSGRTSEAISEYQAQVEELGDVAGLTPVQGPAVTVTLDDAPCPDRDQLPPGMLLEDCFVHQQDMEAVINALWAGGAEAMMVMDQRIIATSSVRCIGPVLFLQGQRYYPPYTVTAIGDVSAMLQALEESPWLSRYRAVAEHLGLGYEVATEGNVEMPGYGGPIGVSSETAL